MASERHKRGRHLSSTRIACFVRWKQRQYACAEEQIKALAHFYKMSFRDGELTSGLITTRAKGLWCILQLCPDIYIYIYIYIYVRTKQSMNESWYWWVCLKLLAVCIFHDSIMCKLPIKNALSCPALPCPVSEAIIIPSASVVER